MRWEVFSAVLAGPLLAFGLAGCNPPNSHSSLQSGNGEGEMRQNERADHSDAEHHHASAGGQSAMDKMKTQLAKLSPEDAASAERQRVCPVSGEMLGTMGVPQKVAVNGEPIWVCCDGCNDKLLASPDEYLANLKSP